MHRSLQGVLTTIVLMVSLALPAIATAGDHGVGVAFAGGTLNQCDPCGGSIDFTGVALFGKIGFTPSWGLLITYRDMEDDENLLFGEQDSYTQLAAQVVYMWLPRQVFRPHVKFGLARTEFEAEVPGFPTLSDDDVAPAFGGGFEVGSPTVAFFFDYDFTFVDIFDDDFDVGNLNLGIIVKF